MDDDFVCKYILFFTQHFFKQSQAGIGREKIKQMLSNTLRLNFSCLKLIYILHPCYHPKIIGDILKNKQKSKHVFTHEITQLIITNMKMKMKNRSHRYNINRPWSRHGHKFSKYKKCLSMMMLICIKKELSNI